ncbi:hypothetical protein [Pedobacter sp. HMWF019]|uniref:hypothetical protein n=1 Tax=Pedobacter sp. HMWF019 TaxID=2056856 RepID=UPI0011B25DE6|nr:hypothetical protein [Pedobacter sp. HMWF019]
MNIQTDLFHTVEDLRRQPLVVAYGLGVDSTAVLVEFQRRGIRPDAILFADTGNEKQETYDYLPVINAWLLSVGFPLVKVVRHFPNKSKKWPEYSSLGENCLTNATLPSLAFGFKSCSLKWKVLPQNIWVDRWLLAKRFWRNGGKVKKVIGYDASPKDMKRYYKVKGMEDEKYEYWYPLVDWGMDREACKASIRAAGLPVPPKSACVFCPATQPAELREHKREYLRLIVMMEARAKHRLEGCMSSGELLQDFERRLSEWEVKVRASSGKRLEILLNKRPVLKKVGAGCAGLWRKATKERPAMMTDFILSEGLLPVHEVEFLQKRVPVEIERNLLAFAEGGRVVNWHDFLEMFTEEDAIDELGHSCGGCVFG